MPSNASVLASDAVSQAVEIVGLVATLLLLFVTFWYAKTTSRMADTARRAAEQSALATGAAERSALAAKDAAQVAQSQIDVEFEGRPVAYKISETPLRHLPTVEIRSKGNAVVVQRVHVRRAFTTDHAGELRRTPALKGVDLVAVGDHQLPYRLHKGERLHFTHPAMSKEGEPLRLFLLDVHYGFAEDGSAGGTRLVTVGES